MLTKCERATSREDSLFSRYRITIADSFVGYDWRSPRASSSSSSSSSSSFASFYRVFPTFGRSHHTDPPPPAPCFRILTCPVRRHRRRLYSVSSRSHTLRSRLGLEGDTMCFGKIARSTRRRREDASDSSVGNEENLKTRRAIQFDRCSK